MSFLQELDSQESNKVSKMQALYQRILRKPMEAIPAELLQCSNSLPLEWGGLGWGWRHL